jgi:hypothetical protein
MYGLTSSKSASSDEAMDIKMFENLLLKCESKSFQVMDLNKSRCLLEEPLGSVESLQIKKGKTVMVVTCQLHPNTWSVLSIDFGNQTICYFSAKFKLCSKTLKMIEKIVGNLYMSCKKEYLKDKSKLYQVLGSEPSWYENTDLFALNIVKKVCSGTPINFQENMLEFKNTL